VPPAPTDGQQPAGPRGAGRGDLRRGGRAQVGQPQAEGSPPVGHREAGAVEELAGGRYAGEPVPACGRDQRGDPPAGVNRSAMPAAAAASKASVPRSSEAHGNWMVTSSTSPCRSAGRASATATTKTAFGRPPRHGGRERSAATPPPLHRPPGRSCGTRLLNCAVAADYAATTYGKALLRRCSETDGVSPDAMAVLSTTENITSGALSASVRPLRTANPYVAGVPTMYDSTSGKQLSSDGVSVALWISRRPFGQDNGGDKTGDALAVGVEISGRVPDVGLVGEVRVVGPEDRPHHRVAGTVDLPPAARV
jgi:hypothetical protein